MIARSLTPAKALAYPKGVSFWEDLSPAVKGYVSIALVLIVLLIAYKSCSEPDEQAAPMPRGYVAP